jgi:2-polyprenyl-3-methyl-5-hydroxy-6-metoxy-1,4-benzoquinol methylase
MLVLDSIRDGSTILELGCATGYFSKELKKKDCNVTGIDIEEESIKFAKKWCDETIVGDLEKSERILLKNKKYDQILLMDVIEHIINRDQLLKSIRNWLSPNGEFILTTPNIAHVSARWNLLFGNFKYTKIGIMDETHVHFYTRASLLDELRSHGFVIKKIVASADFGQIPIFGRVLRRVPKRIQNYITSFFPTFFGVQWLVIATI